VGETLSRNVFQDDCIRCTVNIEAAGKIQCLNELPRLGGKRALGQAVFVSREHLSGDASVRDRGSDARAADEAVVHRFDTASTEPIYIASFLGADFRRASARRDATSGPAHGHRGVQL
jgi:hypothetical protein